METAKNYKKRASLYQDRMAGKLSRRMRIPFKDYRAVIFDMDGTLYYQPPLRLRMAGKLAVYFLCHPLRYRELLAVILFRKIREQWTKTGRDEALDWQQYRKTAEILGISADDVKKAVEYWMYQIPLRLLPGCQDHILARLIRRLRQRCIPVIIYSDYPVREKLRALDIRADFTFCALDQEIMRLKPDPAGLLHILSATGFTPGQTLMIGDRYEKDGMAARNAGIDWLILPSGPKARKKLLKEILHED